MKLIDLEPHWHVDKEGREGQGISFLCPHCLKQRLGVDFENPIDGGTPIPSRVIKNGKGEVDFVTFHWKREGETFETLTLHPSVDASKQGHWHGSITKGEIK